MSEANRPPAPTPLPSAAHPGTRTSETTSQLPQRVMGIDPGPTPGVVSLLVVGGKILTVQVVQCSANALPNVIDALDPHRIQVERFVVRGRANKAQSLTRDQVAQITALGVFSVVARSAVQVMPWATDVRLEAAGLLEATKGMRHAKDAGRHALYCAVHDAGVTDPLSKGAHR